MKYQGKLISTVQNVDIKGVATAITPTAGDNTTKIATTQFVGTAVSNLVNAAPAALDTLNELATALGNDANFSTTVTNNLALKAPLASPTFTGTVSGITATMVGLGNVNNTSDAAKPISTATQSALDLKAPLASPTFTGTVSGITKAMVGLGSVENTALTTWAGSANITTLGTVTAGTFSGTLGAISGASLTNLNASNLVSGTVGTARLGTGTASSSTYLRGDGSWSTISTGATLPVTTALFKGDNAGGASAAVAGTDYLLPNGSGAALTALNASNITAGTVPTAQLGSGTASASTYLRGDGAWATISTGVTLPVTVSLLKGDNAGGASAAVAGTDYLLPNGTGASLTALNGSNISSGTVADARIASTLTGKTYNGITPTAATTGFTLAGGTTSKTLTINNTVGLSGTDGSTLNIGVGGTLGTAAFTAATAYAPAAGSASITTLGTVTTGTFSGTLGAISGASLTNLNASNLASGTVPTAQLGSGTASSSTYLRGDNTWSTISGSVPDFLIQAAGII